MPWEVLSQQEEGLVHLIIEGSHKLRDVQEMCVELFSVAKMSDTWNLLIDTRASVASFSTVDVYRMPRVFKRLGLRHDSRVALLYPSASLQAETFSFLRTVSRNQGFNISLFNDFDDAVRWLRMEPGQEDT